jgi:uncharacterized membrane-anchored protein
MIKGMTKRMTWSASRLSLAAAFLVQALLLTWIVADRALLLAHGSEIRLPVVPVDPRDLFRGDYVVLSYSLSQLRTDRLAGDDGFAEGDTIFVALHKVDDVWSPAALHHSHPGAIALKGRVVHEADGTACSEPCHNYRVAYGLEQFFVLEGEGRALEDLRNDQRIEVDVAVDSGGRAALKRLLVDGTVRYADSLF